MPTTRRTRAMGYSPGGPKQLDINAPTRQPRKTKARAVLEDISAPATKNTRSRAARKRKNEDIIDEEPPAKKSRVYLFAGDLESPASSSRPEIVAPETENERQLEATSLPQKEVAPPAPEQAAEPRVAAQQPTPPLDSPIDDSTEPPVTKPPQIKMKQDGPRATAQRQLKKRTEDARRISDVIRSYKPRLAQEHEEEKALSDCDDNEWAERYTAAMNQVKNPTPFISLSRSEPVPWIPGSTAMLVVRDPPLKEKAPGDGNGSCMPHLNYTPTIRLPALGARSLTKIDTIVAISASLDWYEKNPSITAPSPAEMNAMLDNYARAKKSQQLEAASAVTTKHLQSSTSPVAQSPRSQVEKEDLVEAVNWSQFDDGPSNVTDQEEEEMEEDGDYSADVKQNSAEGTNPQTPQPNDPMQGSRTWSSALSASTIGNVLLTPLNNWFSRRDREKRNIAATEPRPLRREPNAPRLARSGQKPRRQDTPARSSKTLPAKIHSLSDLKANLAPDSPTPTAPQARRGRPDAHLPVHLRGVLFEDLPLEWQAVSQHLKKPQPTQLENNEDEPVDMEQLRAIAKRTREERKMKELQEKAKLIAQKQIALEGADELSLAHVDNQEKKRVTFSPVKTYSTDLGRSTFSMPATSDDSSAEEDEDEESEPLQPRTHFGRSSRPLKSCLKRSYRKATFEDCDEENDGEARYDAHPAKKARLDEFAPAQDPEFLTETDYTPSRSESFLYDDHPQRARPFSRFITKPAGELKAAEAAQLEFERLNPLSKSVGIKAKPRWNSGSQEDSGDHATVFASGGNGSSVKNWLDMFHGPAKRHSSASRLNGSPTKTHFGRPNTRHGQYGSVTQRDETRRRTRNTTPLGEVSEAGLNEKREELVKEKPDTSSTLQVAPSSENKAPRYMAFHGLDLDEEVLRAISAIPDDEIVPERFPTFPGPAEGTLSMEVSKIVKNFDWGEAPTADGPDGSVGDVSMEDI